MRQIAALYAQLALANPKSRGRYRIDQAAEWVDRGKVQREIAELKRKLAEM